MTDDDDGHELTQTSSNGVTETFSYDSRGRTSGIVTKNSAGTTLNSESDVYGTTGDLTSKTVNGTTTTYGYDADDQLTSESSPTYSESYTYDGNGSRLTKTLGSVTDSYSYDNGDKLESVKEGSTTVKSYSYDAQGRTTAVVSAAGTTSMSYDYEDRLTSITLPSGRTDTYTYNGEDTRTGMISSAGSQTFKRAGAGVTAPVLSDGLASYTPGVSRHTSSGSTFYGTDRQGTDSLQTSATGAVAATKVYDGFGMLVSTTGTPVGPFGYNGTSGYQEDADTGLMLLGHRYYDSSTGRFITRDPAKDGSNWYDYVGNNPLIIVDPSGYVAIVPMLKNAWKTFENGEVSISAGGWGLLPGTFGQATVALNLGLNGASLSVTVVHGTGAGLGAGAGASVGWDNGHPNTNGITQTHSHVGGGIFYWTPVAVQVQASDDGSKTVGISGGPGYGYGGGGYAGSTDGGSAGTTWSNIFRKIGKACRQLLSL